MEDPPADSATDAAPDDASPARQEPLLLQFLLGFVLGILPLFLWAFPGDISWVNAPRCLISSGYFFGFAILPADKETRWIGIGLLPGFLLYLLIWAFFGFSLFEQI